jgi:cysteine desulfuration protein SufE
VSTFFSAPEEAPTTRGFAGILHELLNLRSVEEVLAFSEDFPDTLGLAEAVSPLRLRGMRAMLHRLKRQVREKNAA